MKVALITLGCPKNLVDAEVMLGLIDEAGHALVGDVRGADVVIVNTCSFISAAIAESRAIVEECLAAKREGVVGSVIVAGCLPQRFLEETFEIFPGVDAVVGCSSFHEIEDVLATLASSARVYRVGDGAALVDHTAPRILATPPHLAYVKIAEGCDNHCHYCTIPSIRGALRSRTPSSVIEEVRGLLDAGVKEINLIAQDTTAYGTDIASGSLLPELIGDLSELGVPWIRVLYTHPAHVTEELLGAMASERGVVPYLDVPIQHVSDRVLAGMGRGIDGAGVRSLIGRLRNAVPGVTVRSSVMIGFPGEDEEEFEELLAFVEEGNIDYLGVFEFSAEAGTPAFHLEGQVPGEVAAARARLIVDAMEEIAEARGRRALGSEVIVLIDDVDEHATARTAGQAWEMDGTVLIERPSAFSLRPGTFVRVAIEKVSGFDLVAKPVALEGERPEPLETA